MGRKVLLVEDNEYTCEIFATMVRHLGYSCVTARNGREGVVTARSESPDVIFMDYMMPVMDGFEATRSLKAEPATAHIPVVLFTAALGDNIVSEATQAGAVGVLIKPASINEIAKVLRHCLADLPLSISPVVAPTVF